MTFPCKNNCYLFTRLRISRVSTAISICVHSLLALEFLYSQLPHPLLPYLGHLSRYYNGCLRQRTRTYSFLPLFFWFQHLPNVYFLFTTTFRRVFDFYPVVCFHFADGYFLQYHVLNGKLYLQKMLLVLVFNYFIKKTQHHSVSFVY